MTYDGLTWGALAVALSVLGGVITWYRWRRNGLPSLLRGAAWSLLPVAAWLTGVLELVAGISGDVADWALHLAFSPVVWLGICLAGTSVVLFGASAFLRGRQLERGRQAGGTQAAAPAARPAEVSSGTAAASGDTGAEGMDDIEAILRKHGIS